MIDYIKNLFKKKEKKEEKPQKMVMLPKDIVEQMFRYRFYNFEFPFKSSDKKIAEMANAERMRFYNDALQIETNIAWKQELEELVRTYYQELALKALDEKDVYAYRLCLMSLKRLQERLSSLGSLYKPPTVSESLSDRLK